MKWPPNNIGARTGVFFGATSGATTARAQQNSVVPVVLEHLGIAIALIVIPHYIGLWVHTAFA